MSLFTKYLLPVILFLMTIAAAFVAAAEFVGGSLNMLLIMLAVLSAITTILAFRQSAERQRLDQRIHDINRPDASRDTEETADRALEEIEGRLNAAEASVYQLDLVLDAMNDAVILTDINGDIIRLNESAAQMLGYPPNLLFNEPIRTIIAKEHRDKFRLSDDKREVETIFVTRHADRIPVSYTTSRLDEDLFSFSGYIIAARNIAERKVTEQRIRYLARIDPLTKLSNRMQFQHLLQRGIARASRRNHQIVMFYLDVDRFKDINDTFGHTVGDTCLEWIATRLTELLPEKSIIGRLASDEFAIAIEWDGDKNDLAAYTQSTARHIISELNKIMLIQGHEIHLTISVGIAAYPRDADNVVGLIRSADAALCRAKKMPGNSFEFFDAKMNAEEAERLMLKSKLRRSYELDELLVQYQPKFDVMTGEVSGAEALVRWELSERGLILPSEFIPLAEETNLIIEIGEWVLDKVCADIHHWEQHTNIPGRIAINLSLKQLSQPNMLDRIKNTLSRHHVIPADLELEITESTLMNDPEQAIQRLTELHDAGLTLSIDDFGTGYSSLSALRQFPISTLKIDRSFVRDMNTDKDGVKIISAIIDMAHSMNMDVIAEGVESELQLRRLKALRCNHVQGLLFGKPMAADRFLDLLMSGQEERHFHHNLFGK